MTTEISRQTILVTGGAGFIGSHTCVELLNCGYSIVALDNLSNSTTKSLDAVRRITNRSLDFVEGDLRNAKDLEHLFESNRFDAVIHFGGLKAVGESVQQPLLYYENNVIGTVHLINVMKMHSVKTLVFSSSATVYGDPARIPATEDLPTAATNPYGRSKLVIEEMLRDVYAADPEWRISMLRYFNPVGAHASGELGEDPRGTPNNLLPYIAQVAVGHLPHLRVFGNDYATRDGTGVRDYIHVVDLARGHIAALKFLADRPKLAVHNLGTGHGSSVLEALRAFEEASGRTIPYRVVERRPGDIAECYADTTKAHRELGWAAEYDLKDMCRDAWKWQSRHPNGFG
jgi:UDP-glucose 4-epimerase